MVELIDFDGSYSCVDYLNLLKGPVFAPVFHNTVLMCKFNDFWCRYCFSQQESVFCLSDCVFSTLVLQWLSSYLQNLEHWVAVVGLGISVWKVTSLWTESLSAERASLCQTMGESAAKYLGIILQLFTCVDLSSWVECFEDDITVSAIWSWLPWLNPSRESNFKGCWNFSKHQWPVNSPG